MLHFLQITIARKTLPFLKKNYTNSPDRKLQNRSLSANYDRKKTGPFLNKNYTISRDHELQKWATVCKLRSQEKLYHFSRETIQFLVIANCRNGPLSANYDRKRNYKISQEKLYKFSESRIAEKSHFLQITIARKTVPFLKKTYTISPDRKLQSRATSCKLRSQEKLDHFSTKTTQFLVITNCRNGPLSANYDRKKNYKISQEKLYKFSGSRIAEKSHVLQITIARKTRPFLEKNYTISRDREMQKWATFCKLRSQEKLYHFSRKTIQFLLIANCRIGPLSANYDHKKNFTISQEKLHNFS